MTAWSEISAESARAAAACTRSDCPRSAVSRAYYAFFASLTDVLKKKRVKLHHVTNPAHRQVVGHIKNDLSLSPVSQRRLVSLARSLYDRRLDADYNGLYAVDERTARESLRDMREARQILEALR